MKSFVLLLLVAALFSSAWCACPANCLCSSQGNPSSCTDCLPGSRPGPADALTCIICPEGQGHDGLPAPSGTCSQSACATNCAVCTNMAAQCVICKDGYYLTKSGTNSYGTCSMCPGGKTRARFTAVPSTITSEAVDTVCVACDASCAACTAPGAGKCLYCAKDHWWAGSGTCTKCADGTTKDAQTVAPTAAETAGACKSPAKSSGMLIPVMFGTVFTAYSLC